jgi:hypothetical protein
MQKHTFPRAGSGITEPGRGGKPSAVGGASSGPQRQPSAMKDARDVGASQPLTPNLHGDRVEIAVIEKQIDQIHQDLDTQMYRTAQVETVLIGIRDELRDLMELVKCLRNDAWNNAAYVVGTPRKVFH